ncbi:MAG: QueT transporter family protein [Clostridia bacterium]
MTSSTRYLARAGLIAALYVVTVYAFRPISFGPGQIRVAEALAVLPLFEGAAVPGLFLGCLFANLLGGLGPWDVVGGSLITLVAAMLTHRSPGFFIGILPPILLNAFGVSAYLSLLTRVPYPVLVPQVLFGQVVAVGGIGGLLHLILSRIGIGMGLRRHYHDAN